MEIKRFESGSRMSQAVVYNNTVYLAGQVGNAGDDVVTQTKQALAGGRSSAGARRHGQDAHSFRDRLARRHGGFRQDEFGLGRLGASGPRAGARATGEAKSQPRNISSKSS